MFVSRRTHEFIIGLFQKRIDELTEERDFYRRSYLETTGRRFPDPPQPAAVTAIQSEIRPQSEIELRKTFRLDRSDWSSDDYDFFQDYWKSPARARGIPDDEMDFWYAQAHGNKLPMGVFVEAAYG